MRPLNSLNKVASHSQPCRVNIYLPRIFWMPSVMALSI